MRLENKSVVVTGASAGMGQAIVERFVQEGANVVAVARRLDRLEELVESLKDAPGRVVPCQGDISDPEASVKMIDLAVKEFGRLDVLVNNAGSGLKSTTATAIPPGRKEPTKITTGSCAGSFPREQILQRSVSGSSRRRWTG